MDSNPQNRGVAQLGRALPSGGRGRRFESSHPDQLRCWETKDPVGSDAYALPFRYRKNKNPQKIGACARNTPFGAWREALTCSRIGKAKIPRGPARMPGSTPFQSWREALAYSHPAKRFTFVICHWRAKLRNRCSPLSRKSSTKRSRNIKEILVETFAR